MTGIDWLDAVSVVAFGTVTVLALIRLGRDRTCGLHRFLDDGFHAVMGVAMTAMFWPGSGRSTAAWVAVLGLVVVWPLLVLALATRRTSPAPDGRVSLGHTGYWLVCALLMVVAVGAGHGSASASASAASAASAADSGSGMRASMPTRPGTVHPAEAGIGALGNAFRMVAEWPIWPLVGIGFLMYAGLMLLNRRRPITERACAAVMAAGMAVMAWSL